ncbi:MAG: acyl-CoA thioesterase [Alphaproteobacteria bacterium]
MNAKEPKPFRVTRQVRWGDCDPAGIIYTPRALDYAMETLEAWLEEVLGFTWSKLNREMSMGMPTVRAELDFLDTPTVDQDLIMELQVVRTGRSSITFRITGHDGNGRTFFRAKLISCLVSKPAFEPIEIPGEFRERILAYSG